MKGAQIVTVPRSDRLATTKDPYTYARTLATFPDSVTRADRPLLTAMRTFVDALQSSPPSRGQVTAGQDVRQAQPALSNGLPTARRQEAQHGHLKTPHIGSPGAPRVDRAGAPNRAAMALAAVGAPSQQANGQQAVSGAAHNSPAFGGRTWSRTPVKPVLSLGQ